MTQHLVLMAVAPPLILLGAPIVPMLRGLPRWLVRDALGPFLAWPALRRVAHRLTHPGVGLSVMTAAMWGWHVPGPYQLALQVPFWHDVEHVTFFAGVAALLVVGRQAVAVHPALVRVVDPADAAPRRHLEHGHRRHAHVLRAGPVSGLRAGPAPRGPLGARRPGPGRRRDVGAGIAGVPRPRDRRDGSPALAGRPSSPEDRADAEAQAITSRRAVRSAGHTAHRCVPARTTRPARPAGNASGAGHRRHRRRALRRPDGRDESRGRAALDLLALLRHRRIARGGQRVLHGVPVHAAARARDAASDSPRATGPGRCDRSGWPSSCWRSSSGPTKRSPCGTARSGPPGSSWPTSSAPSSSTRCSAAPASASTSAPSGSSSS